MLVFWFILEGPLNGTASAHTTCNRNLLVFIDQICAYIGIWAAY
jgi:hypothetical protein